MEHTSAAQAPVAESSSSVGQYRGELVTRRSREDERPVGDVVLAVGLLVVAIPVLVVAAIFIKLTSRGPVIYSQPRLGIAGRTFTIYKLRTMRHNCEAVSGIRWAAPGDTRVTWVGRVLRKTHIDELPQLWNIIRGDMRLIGPRPERPEIADELIRLIPGYADRLQVLPGVTGLAQIQLPPDEDIDSVRRKLGLDLVYIRSQGVWLNLRIVTGTGFHLIGASRSFIRTVLRLPTTATGHFVSDPGCA